MTKNFPKSEDYRRMYTTSAFGGFSIYDVRMNLVDMQDGHPETQAEVIMTPLAAKQLAVWLTSQVKEYERMFGKIKDKPTAKAKKKLEENKKQAKTAGYS